MKTDTNNIQDTLNLILEKLDHLEKEVHELKTDYKDRIDNLSEIHEDWLYRVVDLEEQVYDYEDTEPLSEEASNKDDSTDKKA